MKFEDNLKKLEQLVRNMESGEMKLDEMIADAKNSVTEAAAGTGQRVYWDSVRRIAVLVR